jgi:hypothetical protein
MVGVQGRSPDPGVRRRPDGADVVLFDLTAF